jgi:hypothetical protein
VAAISQCAGERNPHFCWFVELVSQRLVNVAAQSRHASYIRRARKSNRFDESGFQQRIAQSRAVRLIFEVDDRQRPENPSMLRLP